MRVITGNEAARARFEKAVVTVGNFDGVHIGHAAILGTVVDRAGLLGAEADPTSPACGSACRADLNGDGAVLLDDVVEILAAMTTTQAPEPDPAADLNGDGFVGLDDVVEALRMLGSAPGPGPDTCGIANPCD